MARVGRGTIELRLTGFDAIRQRLLALQRGFETMGRVATRALVGIGAGLAFTVKRAGDAQAIVNQFGEVFKEQTTEAERFVRLTATAMGRSEMALRRYMATLQDTFVPMGFARDQGLELSKALTQLTIDITSFKEEFTEAEVLERLTSTLVGNHEAVRAFGVQITEATLKQELLRLGVTKAANQLTIQEKVLGRLSLILKSTTDAQGDAARTADEFGNQVRSLRARFNALATTVGDLFLPLATKLVATVSALTHGMKLWVEQNGEAVKNLAATVTKILILMALLPKLIGLLTVLRRSLIGLALVRLFTTKVGLAIAAGLALGHGLTIAIHGTERLKEKYQELGETLAGVGKGILDIFDNLLGKVGENLRQRFGMDQLIKDMQQAQKEAQRLLEETEGTGGAKATISRLLADAGAGQAGRTKFKSQTVGLADMFTRLQTAVLGSRAPDVAAQQLAVQKDIRTGINELVANSQRGSLVGP